MDEYISIQPERQEHDPNLSPFDNIKAAAEKFGIQIKNPKDSCRKCHGRGYIGINVSKAREPIPCSCILPDMNEETKFAYDNRNWVPKNRKERRYAQKLMRRA